jgi:DNA repair exonuclease SbcCD nuclease subunit
MERTKLNKNPDLILCSDMHLREDTPVCYTGDYQEEQWECLYFISDLQKKYDCPVVHGGDLFNKYNTSPWLLSMTARYLPKKFFTIAGQHDLKAHSFELIDKSGINTLAVTEQLILLPRVHFGYTPDDFHYQQDAGIENWVLPNKERKLDLTGWQEISKIDKISVSKDIRKPFPDASNPIKHRKILVWHKLAYQTIPFPGATGGNAKELLKKYPYDLILTGDNHQSFVEEYQGRLLVNPGSMMRMTAAQIDHRPRVYLWYAEENKVVPIFLPIKEGVITREHLDVVEQRDNRITAFISQLSSDWKSQMSFEDNLIVFQSKNNVSKEVMDIIYKSLADEK